MARTKITDVRRPRASPTSLAAHLASAGGSDSTRPPHELVRNLISLIRLKTVNPPGNELAAAQHIARLLARAGVPVSVYEPFPQRGSLIARLRGDGTAGGPLLLLSHLDVVPADERGWRHPPFAARVEDGHVYGRGAADMKFMVALELQLMLEIARHARALSIDLTRDPVPGLRRDLIFASTADEESGGDHGIGWLVANRPAEIMAEAAINEAGAFSVEAFGRRFYPIQVAEKGKLTFRISVTGATGHGAMPRRDNAAVLMARVIDRLADLEPMRLTVLMQTAITQIEANLPARAAKRFHTAVTEHQLGSRPSSSWVFRALQSTTRDTFSPTIATSGVKYNVIPGTALIEIDCRVLPGSSRAQVQHVIRRRIGDDLMAHCQVDVIGTGPALEQPVDHPILEHMTASLLTHDPDGIVVRMMAPFSTDARHTTRLGIPTYGFSPLRFENREPFLDLFHANDERIPIAALGFGFKVLSSLVETYCAA